MNAPGYSRIYLVVLVGLLAVALHPLPGLAQSSSGASSASRPQAPSQRNERAIFVRFVISAITPDSLRLEQSFSDDGGKTWEVNWIAIDTRMKDAP